MYEDPKDETKVLKVMNLHQQDKPTVSEFCCRQIGFNAMFPPTKYELVGFTEHETNKTVIPILRQAYINGDELKNLPVEDYNKFVQQYKKAGFDVETGFSTTLKYGNYVATDLHAENIIKCSKDDRYYAIDAFVRKIQID